MKDWLFIVVMVALVSLSIGAFIGEDVGVRKAECQRAGYGAPSWLSVACTVWLEPIK